MSWRLSILAAVLAWLFMASPAVLNAAEKADSGIEVRNGTRTQNLAHLTRTLLSQQGFDVVQIGNHIDFGAEATVIYYRIEAEKAASALRSEIFPGARIEESSSLKNGIDIKVLLGHDLEVQPRMLARLLGEEVAASPPAVKAPTPEPRPPPRYLAAKETAGPASISAPATAEPSRPQIQAPPPVPAAASAAKSGAIQRHTDSRAVLAAAEKADSGIEVRNGTRTQNLAHLTRTLLSQQGFDVVEIGNHIDFGVEATVIYYRTEAEKAARALRSEIFPGARIEESSRLKNGIDIKVLLGHDLEVQPRMLARLLVEELAASPPAVKAPTPEPGPPPRSTAAKETAAPASISAPATAEPNCPQIQAPPPLPAAASAAKSGGIQRHTDSRGVLHIANVSPSQPTPSQPYSPSAVPDAMMAEPQRGRSRHLRLPGQNEETYIPEADLDALQKVFEGLARGEAQAGEIDGIIAAAGQTAAEKEATEAVVDYNYLPVRQVSPDQEVFPAPAPQPDAPKIDEASAAGDIRHYLDARGVLNIGNVAPSQPTPSQPYSPSSVREALMAGPRRGWSRHLRLLGQIEETFTPEADRDALQKVWQGLVLGEAQAHEFDGIIAAAGQAATGGEINPPAQGILAMTAAAATAAAESTIEAGPDHLKKGSYEAAEAGASPASAPQTAAPKAAEMVTAGGIQRNRDSQGVWHISSVAPAAAGAGPAGLEATKVPGAEKTSPDKPARLAAMVTAGRPLPEVSWTQDYPDLATLPTTSSPFKQAAPSELSLIWHYRDSKGMIHISNADPEPREAPQPAGLMVRSRSDSGYEPQVRPQVPALVENEGNLAWRPAAWNGEGGIKPLKRVQAAPSQTAEFITEGGIRRYRDKQGIIHIKTVEYPLPPGVVLPPRQAGPSLMTPIAAAPTASVISNLPGSAASALPANPATLSGARPRITAFKDARGRLRITTELPPPVPGKMPPPMPVYAELEPIILEAAQIHRLPPTLIKAVIKAESDFCSWAVSPKGAMGLMQLMPGTADFLGVREPFNPRDNVLGGCRYLRMLIDLFGGNVPLALASYNAGFQRVIDCGYQIPSIKETQDFVTTVMGRYVAEEKRGRQPAT